MGICVIGKGDILYWTGLDWTGLNPKMCLCAAVCKCHQYIKILNVCVSVSNRSGKFREWDYSSDARPSYLYFVLHVCDVDALEEQQYSQGATAGADTMQD